jgi:hypothetical protein
MPHVSWVTDIAELFGTRSVPVVVAVSVFGVFELGERLASQRAKDALSKWLLSFDIKKAKALPDGTQELFERIFGKRHFSLQCFIRSVMFSLCAMAFIAILIFFINPKATFKMADTFLKPLGMFRYGDWLMLTIWLPWSILIDYVSLFKTRFILKVLTRMREKHNLLVLAILVIDFLVYKLIYSIGLVLTLSTLFGVNWGWSVSDFFDFGLIIAAMFDYEFMYRGNLFSIFFWAGFAPSLWMWLYVAALFVTRGLLRSEKLINLLRLFLDVEKNPFRSIGAVAAALAFIVSVAIILVSLEVSRISTAS